MSDSLQPHTLASQAPLSMEFARQEYWSGLPFPTPEDLPNPRIEPVSLEPPALQADSYHCTTWEALVLNKAYRLVDFLFQLL